MVYTHIHTHRYSNAHAHPSRLKLGQRFCLPPYRQIIHEWKTWCFEKGGASSMRKSSPSSSLSSPSSLIGGDSLQTLTKSCACLRVLFEGYFRKKGGRTAEGLETKLYDYVLLLYLSWDLCISLALFHYVSSIPSIIYFLISIHQSFPSVLKTWLFVLAYRSITVRRSTSSVRTKR